MIVLELLSTYEDDIFRRIVVRTLNKNMSNETKVLKLMEITHILLGPPRLHMLLPLNKKHPIEVGASLDIHSSLFSLLGGYSCWNHAQVLGRLLTMAGFKYKISCMYYKGYVHCIGEVKLGKKWVVVDPLFNQVFRNEKGDLVGKDEIHNRWDFYKNQVGLYVLNDEIKKYIPRYKKYYNYTFHPVKLTLKAKIFIKLFGEDYYNYLQLNKFKYWEWKLTLYMGLLVLLLLFLWFYFSNLSKAKGSVHAENKTI